MHMENCDELALCVEEPVANIRETYTCNKQMSISVGAREMSCSHSFAWHCVQTLANHALSIHQNLGTLVSEPRPCTQANQLKNFTGAVPCKFSCCIPSGLRNCGCHMPDNANPRACAAWSRNAGCCNSSAFDNCDSHTRGRTNRRATAAASMAGDPCNPNWRKT